MARIFLVSSVPEGQTAALLLGCSGFCPVLFYNNHGLGVAVASNTLGGDRGPSYCNQRGENATGPYLLHFEGEIADHL